MTPMIGGQDVKGWSGGSSGEVREVGREGQGWERVRAEGGREDHNNEGK